MEFVNQSGAIEVLTYIAAAQHGLTFNYFVSGGNLIYTAGMTSRKNGILIQSGKVLTDEPVSTYKSAVLQAVANALTAAENTLTEQERLEQILSLTVYVNAEESFQAHTSLADFASDYLRERMGNAGVGSRTAIGVASLPGNAPIEIQLVAILSS